MCIQQKQSKFMEAGSTQWALLWLKLIVEQSFHVVLQTRSKQTKVKNESAKKNYDDK